MPYSSPAQRAAVWANRKYQDVENLDAVVIDSPSTGIKLTKKDVLDYYMTPEVKRRLLRELKGKDLVTVLNREPGVPIVRRYRKAGEPLRARTGDDIAWFAERRYSEFHPTIGKTTDHVWVDIDAGKNVGVEELKPAVRDVQREVAKLPGVKKTDVAFSGGTGFYVRGKLDAERDTDVLERSIKRIMAKLSRRKNPYVVRPPKADEIRLDVSTFHDQGSIRAPYSLNSETGLVSVRVPDNQLKGFDPTTHANPLEVITKLRRKKKRPEFAPGIPGGKAVEKIPTFRQPKSWMLAVQEHKAERAGKHYDLRLVDPWTGHAHSWALPKAKLPASKENVLAIQTPTHSSDYALGFGAGGPRAIMKGYGKGTVEIKHKEPVQVLAASPDKVKFRRRVNGNEEDFVLFRTKDDSWLLRNTTEKQGADMDTLFWKGFDETLQKLGATKKIKSLLKQKRLSTSEAQQPLDVGDQGMPASDLAQVLSGVTVPQRTEGDKGEDNVEDRLNRKTVWGPKEEISHEVASGPSPIGLGF
ncbi:MAG: hypothetical protein DRP83_02295 [Planctomycetota bacterium]|nr:MAG: hypothetical protein DRP83_02295 [Planctomycetota bacterium]